MIQVRAKNQADATKLSSMSWQKTPNENRNRNCEITRSISKFPNIRRRLKGLIQLTDGIFDHLKRFNTHPNRNQLPHNRGSVWKVLLYVYYNKSIAGLSDVLSESPAKSENFRNILFSYDWIFKEKCSILIFFFSQCSLIFENITSPKR